jgi:hypothetical protein
MDKIVVDIIYKNTIEYEKSDEQTVEDWEAFKTAMLNNIEYRLSTVQGSSATVGISAEFSGGIYISKIKHEQKVDDVIAVHVEEPVESPIILAEPPNVLVETPSILVEKPSVPVETPSDTTVTSVQS